MLAFDAAARHLTAAELICTWFAIAAEGLTVRQAEALAR